MPVFRSLLEDVGGTRVRTYLHSGNSAAARLLSSKRFPVVASARNWRTVLALRDLATD